MYEENYQQKFREALDKVNTKEQQERANFYITKYHNLNTEIEEEKVEWEKIEKLYRTERNIKSENDPNSFDPIILPIIEGQVSAITEKNISASVKGEGYADQRFARTGQILADFGYRNIRIRSKIKSGVRRYLLFGMGCFALGFDPDALSGFGLPEWRCPQITKVFVDGKIKDILDVDKAEYIIEEVGSFSIMSARKEYGDDIANAVQLGNLNPDFGGKTSQDDKDSFTKLIVWTRNNEEGNLQRLDISLCGVMLKESDPKEPFYEEVDNKYPYFFFGLYPQEGRFHRFGDGKLLKRLQVLINNLWDECVIACRFSAQARTFIDPSAQCDPDQFDSDPQHPIMARKPNETIRTVQGVGVNQVVFQLISLILNEIQRITRFSELMMGTAPGREITATQSGIMIQQGNSGTDDKKGDVSEAISEATKYMLGLMMQFWPTEKAIRLSDDTEETEWVDARQLKNVPAVMPVDSAYEKQWKAFNPDKPVPKYMQLETEGEKDSDGIPKMEPQTKRVALDVQVSIGEGLPTNKLALANLIMSMSRMVLPDEQTGQPRSLLSFQQVQKMFEDILGMPLYKAVQSLPVMPNIQGSPNQNIPNAQTPTTANPYIEGAGGATGLMSNQPMEVGQ